jgi:hypothetical protein
MCYLIVLPICGGASALRHAIAEVKQRWSKIYYLELLCASEGTLSHWSLINRHWARVVVYGPFSLCVLHKEGLCPSSGDINRVIIIIIIIR